MDGTTSYLLVGTAVATAAFHTLIPDHWLPFVLVARARGWPVRLTAAVSGFSALLHTSLSVALGLAAVRVGQETMGALGETLERASGVLLVLFGLLYAAWAWRKGGHFHPGGAIFHRREEGPACDGLEGDSGPAHLHYHADRALIEGRAERGAVFLAIIVGLNPCALVLPILLAAAGRGVRAVVAVSAAYCVTTIAMMVGLSVAASAVGARRLAPPVGARAMEVASGLLIALLGTVLWFLE